MGVFLPKKKTNKPILGMRETMPSLISDSINDTKCTAELVWVALFNIKIRGIEMTLKCQESQCGENQGQ